jgi:putative ABC transport system permease protein
VIIRTEGGNNAMYIFINSIKNLFRNKGRNIIISMIILTMLTFTAISMIINAATVNVIKNYKEQFGSEIYLQYDDEKISEDQKNGGWADIPEISDELKISLADSEYLKETMIRVMYPSYAKELKGIDQDKNENIDAVGTAPVGNGSYYEPNVTVFGYNTPELLQDFKEGKRKIINGSMFEKEGECVISQDLAELNGLKPGDKISISDLDKSATFEPLELTVSGIYFDMTEDQPSYISAGNNRRNDVMTTYETMSKYQNNVAKTKLFTVETTYFLKHPELLEKFREEAHEKGLHKNYKLSTDEMSYNKIVKPAEGLAKVSSVFLMAVLLIGSIILILLSVLSIRERKYEIGVLRAMGMKKTKVVRGILYESLITIGICLVIGLSIGAITAQPVSDKITESQQVQMQNNNFGDALVEPQEINVSLTPHAVLNVSGIAVLLAILSSSVGVLYILRYEPMKILSERN